jgi:ferritin-like metal-binding protein YciE
MAATRQGRSTLVEYLGRARDEERRIETALAAHLVMVGRPSYQKRLEKHLEATKLRATELEKQIKRLGGTVSRTAAGSAGTREVRQAAKRVTDRAVELAEGSVEKLRHDAEASKLLDNARAEYADAAAQVGNYSVVRALAKAAGDKNTGRLAKTFRDEHADVAEYVRKLIPKLSKAAVEAEASKPAPRSGSRGSSRAASSRSSSSKRTTASAAKRSTTGRSRSSAKRATPASAASGAKRTTARAASGTTRASGTKRAASGAKTAAAGTKRTTSRAASNTKRATTGAKRSSAAKS